MSQKKSVADVASVIDKHILADSIAGLWSTHEMNRLPWLEQRKEVRDYLFATDTNSTSNSSLPWKNKTTLPKLTQIRDNLHANYMSALFPNDDWLTWEGHSVDAVIKEKRAAIEAYMKNKVRESGFMLTTEELLLDYIDNGNAFYDVIWVNESTEDPDTGALIPGYIGPKMTRVSYRDLVFDARASSFTDSWKIHRSLKPFGQLMQEIEDFPDLAYNRDIMAKAAQLRMGGFGLGADDLNLITAFQVDGFGSYSDYLKSDYVEILEFEGSIFDKETGVLYKNYVITVVDRAWVVRKERMPSWMGKSYKGYCPWRKRPDNLYGMGPLDNLIGMQYRIDHLENAKADAIDLSIQPPLVISGSVEDFNYYPGSEIYVGEGGTITELGKNLNGVIGAQNDIDQYEQRMEQMAGAPKEAMGIRTPGEKTKFEVQTLEMAASRIFQQKLRSFELNIIEPALNKMLEISRRHMDASDLVRVMDDDLGVAAFLTVTKEDITASGKIRPIGARHFAAQATLVQNLLGFFQSPLGMDAGVRAHISGKALAKMLEELLGVERWELFSDNIQVVESIETEQLRQQGLEELELVAATPAEAPPPLPQESE